MMMSRPLHAAAALVPMVIAVLMIMTASVPAGGALARAMMPCEESKKARDAWQEATLRGKYIEYEWKQNEDCIENPENMAPRAVTGGAFLSVPDAMDSMMTAMLFVLNEKNSFQVTPGIAHKIMFNPYWNLRSNEVAKTGLKCMNLVDYANFLVDGMRKYTIAPTKVPGLLDALDRARIAWNRLPWW